jgi:hypothetical protein
MYEMGQITHCTPQQWTQLVVSFTIRLLCTGREIFAFRKMDPSADHKMVAKKLNSSS